MNVKDFQSRTEARLFDTLNAALADFLRDHAPLYKIDRVGLQDNFAENEIVIKLHLKQKASAKEAAWDLPRADRHE